MENNYKGKLIKIFIEGNDKYNNKPLYEGIINKLKDLGVSGATIIRGIEGFGEDKKVHTDLLEVLSRKLPILIEVAAIEENSDLIISSISPMIKSGKIVVVNNIDIISFEE